VLFECTSPPEPLLSPLAPPPTEWYDLSGLSASWGPSLSSSPDELAVDPFPTVLCHELVVPSEPSERAPVPRGPRGRRRPYRHAAREGRVMRPSSSVAPSSGGSEGQGAGTTARGTARERVYLSPPHMGDAERE